MPKKSGLTNEAASEETRRALMKAAADLIRERGPNTTLESLTIRSICQRADRTTGAFYGQWPTGLADFGPDLLIFLQDPIWQEDLASLEKVLAGAVKRGEDLGRQLSRLAEADLQALTENPWWRTQVDMILRYCEQPKVRDACREGYRLVDEEFGHLYFGVLEKNGTKPPNNLTAEDFGVIAQALVEGFTLRALVDPERVISHSVSNLYVFAITTLLGLMRSASHK